jgi:hypothetical protein
VFLDVVAQSYIIKIKKSILSLKKIDKIQVKITWVSINGYFLSTNDHKLLGSVKLLGLAIYGAWGHAP